MLSVIYLESGFYPDSIFYGEVSRNICLRIDLEPFMFVTVVVMFPPSGKVGVLSAGSGIPMWKQ